MHTDLPICFVRLNALLKSASAQFSSVAEQLTKATTVLEAHHTEPVVFDSDITDSSGLSSFNQLTETLGAPPSFGESLSGGSLAI